MLILEKRVLMSALSCLTRPFLMDLPCEILIFWGCQHFSIDRALTTKNKYMYT